MRIGGHVKEPESESILVKMGDAISQVMQIEDEMVVRWVAVVEIIDKDGERGCWTLAHEGARTWDIFGLMQFAISREQAGMNRAAQDD